MRLLTFAVAMVAACFVWGGFVQASVPVTIGPDFRATVEKQTFALINQYRKAHDFPPLVWNEAITKEARGHSKDMATGDVDFGHDGFRERVDRLKGGMNGFRGAGENVFMTDDLHEVAQKAVTTWLHSPHHLENIRGDFNYSGLGVWQDKDGAIFFTQIFMKFEPVPQETEREVPRSQVALGAALAEAISLPILVRAK